MAKFDNPLNNLKVASPCSQDWNAMIGSERKRASLAKDSDGLSS